MAELTTRAILSDDGTLRVTVVGREVFGKKIATIDSESAGLKISDDTLSDIKDALAKARDEANKDEAVAKRAQIAAYESAQIALRMGEDI